MVPDVSEDVDLVGSICDRLGMATLGPQAAFFRAEALLADAMGRVLFRPAHPMANVVIGKAGEDVQVTGIEGDYEDLNTALEEFHRDLISHELAQRGRDADGVARHQGFGQLVERIILPLGGRMFVVPFDMLAVVSGAPSSRIAAQP